MPSAVIPAIPASQLVNIVPSILVAGGNPLQFWGMFVDANLDSNGYPLMPYGMTMLFADAADVAVYFGGISQESGLAAVYFAGPISATRTPSGLLAAQYALDAIPGYLRGGDVTGMALGQLQAIDGTLTVSIDGNAPISATIDLAAATSFSGAAGIIGSALGIKGIPKGEFTASLSASGTTMTVAPFDPSSAGGALQATFTANLLGTTMTVTDVAGGYPQPGMLVVGTGIPAGTTIAAYEGGGQPGGPGAYALSAGVSTEVGETVRAYAAQPTIQVGDVVTGTGILANTYVTGQTSGNIGADGVYTLSQAVTTEADATIQQYAPGCTFDPTHGAFVIHSGIAGSNSSVSFGSDVAAVALLLLQSQGAIQSPGADADSPSAFMDNIIAQTANWVSFMTLWEPTDRDKSTNSASSFAGWTNAQNDGYRYCMWETDVVDTAGGPSAAVAMINDADLSGTVMIYTDPNITTLAGEKAAFSMGWAASLDFTRHLGRQTAAFKSYTGGLPDVTSGTVAEALGGAPQTGTFGNGMNFYGDYTTRSQGFPQYQRGVISGPFVWDDSYTNLAIWLPNALQEAIMIGLSQAPSVPYAGPGYAQIESWVLDPILAAVNFGAIVPGVNLSQAQINAVNQQAGIDIAQTIVSRGWYFQVQPAPAAIRAIRASPSCTLWASDGGSVQALTIAAITIQ